MSPRQGVVVCRIRMETLKFTVLNSALKGPFSQNVRPNRKLYPSLVNSDLELLLSSTALWVGLQPI